MHVPDFCICHNRATLRQDHTVVEMPEPKVGDVRGPRSLLPKSWNEEWPR